MRLITQPKRSAHFCRRTALWRPHLVGKALKAHEIIGQQTITHQLQRQNAVRAFQDGIEPVVAVELLHRVVARVAIAAQHLNGQRIGNQAVVR